MMNRPFSMLSILSLLALISYSLLMIFQVLNPIIHLKYLLIVFSLLFTFLSLGLFTFQEEVSKIQYYLFIILLILPLFIPLMGLFSGDLYTKYWKIFIGGIIFQIGTGIYALFGGFIKKKVYSTLKIVALINYSLFLLLVFILFFDITILTRGFVFGSVGCVVSCLSLLIFILRKPSIEVV